MTMRRTQEIVTALVLALGLGAAGVARADDATVKLYKAQCASCHGVDGKGQTTAGKKVGVKDWTNPADLKDFNVADIEKTINEGVVGTDGKRRMTSFSTLGPDKIKALEAYVRVLMSK
jgi:mono/diheme cytochrome c family protein